jgi:hypothetical protein
MAGVRGSSRFRTAQIHSLSMPVFVFKNNIAKVDPNHQKRDLSVVLVGHGTHWSKFHIWPQAMKKPSEANGSAGV